MLTKVNAEALRWVCHHEYATVKSDTGSHSKHCLFACLRCTYTKLYSPY